MSGVVGARWPQVRHLGRRGGRKTGRGRGVKGRGRGRGRGRAVQLKLWETPIFPKDEP